MEIVYKYIYIFAPFVYISLTGSPYTHALKIIDKQNFSLLIDDLEFELPKEQLNELKTLIDNGQTFLEGKMALILPSKQD